MNRWHLRVALLSAALFFVLFLLFVQLGLALRGDTGRLQHRQGCAATHTAAGC